MVMSNFFKVDLSKSDTFVVFILIHLFICTAFLPIDVGVDALFNVRLSNSIFIGFEVFDFSNYFAKYMGTPRPAMIPIYFYFIYLWRSELKGFKIHEGCVDVTTLFLFKKSYKIDISEIFYHNSDMGRAICYIEIEGTIEGEFKHIKLVNSKLRKKDIRKKLFNFTEANGISLLYNGKKVMHVDELL